MKTETERALELIKMFDVYAIHVPGCIILELNRYGCPLYSKTYWERVKLEIIRILRDKQTMEKIKHENTI